MAVKSVCRVCNINILMSEKIMHTTRDMRGLESHTIIKSRLITSLVIRITTYYFPCYIVYLQWCRLHQVNNFCCTMYLKSYMRCKGNLKLYTF